MLELLGLVVQHLEATDIVLEEVSERAVVGVLACTDLLIEDVLPARWVVQRSEVVVTLVDQIVEGVYLLPKGQRDGLHHVPVDLLQGPEEVHPVLLKVWERFLWWPQIRGVIMMLFVASTLKHLLLIRLCFIELLDLCNLATVFIDIRQLLGANRGPSPVARSLVVNLLLDLRW